MQLEFLFNILETLQLILANPGTVVLDKLHASKFAEVIGADRIFLSVADATQTFGPKVDHA